MSDDENQLHPLALLLMLATILLLVMCCSCSTNHYFSITSDSMENPNITYRDSVTLTNPF